MARTGVIYGESGTRKTTAVADFARYIYERTGKLTNLLSFDGGGWGPCQPLIDIGVIRAFRPTFAIPLPMIRLISLGYWPENPDETQVSKLNFVPCDWSEIGGAAVEGLTSISTTIMRHLADKQIKTGEEATSPFSQRILQDGEVREITFAGNSRAHYGFVQNQIKGMVLQFGTLPYEYVLFTALEARTEEDDRTTIYGPAVAGKKGTAEIPSLVGDCIHAQGFNETRGTVGAEVVDTTVRFYYQRHPDPQTGIDFPAKARLPETMIAEMAKRMPGGYFVPGIEPGSGFGRYLRTVDELNAGAGDAMKAWREAMDRKRAGLTKAAIYAVATEKSTEAGKQEK